MPDLDRPTTYQITVCGQLNERWSEWFDGMSIVHQTEAGKIPTTTLEGVLADQATLRGLLTKVWDLGLVLISISSEPQE